MPRLKVACVQVSPVHGDPAGNMKAADELLAGLTRADGVDVLLLPEMAFSGYCFDDAAAMRGVLETDRGATVEWCKENARRLQCTVLCGYPRRVVDDDEEEEDDVARGALGKPNNKKQKNDEDDVDDDDNDNDKRGGGGGGGGGGGAGGEDDNPPTTSAATGGGTETSHDDDDDKDDKDDAQLYNAMVVVGPDGTILAHYHKSFLYCIDKTWATEGAGFTTVSVPIISSSQSRGEKKRVEDEEGEREGEGEEEGDGGRAEPATTFMHSPGDEEEEEASPRGGLGEESESESESVLASLGICMDINPREFEAPWDAYELANACKSHGSSLLLFSSAWTNSHPDDDPRTVSPVNRNEILTYWLNRLVPLVGSDVHFVCANRVGMENGITFTGCSCVMSLREPRLIAALGPKDVGVMVQEITVPTFAQLAERRRKKAEEEAAAVARGGGGVRGGDSDEANGGGKDWGAHGSSSGGFSEEDDDYSWDSFEEGDVLYQ